MALGGVCRGPGAGGGVGGWSVDCDYTPRDGAWPFPDGYKRARMATKKGSSGPVVGGLKGKPLTPAPLPQEMETQRGPRAVEGKGGAAIGGRESCAAHGGGPGLEARR